MYQECFNLIVEHIYGNPEVLTTYQELVCTNLATYLSIMTVALPFIGALMTVKMAVGR